MLNCTTALYEVTVRCQTDPILPTAHRPRRATKELAAVGALVLRVLRTAYFQQGKTTVTWLDRGLSYGLLRADVRACLMMGLLLEMPAQGGE